MVVVLRICSTLRQILYLGLKIKNICILMHSQESKTIRELREIAKQRKMVGYYKLRKADLITAISKHGSGVIDLLDTPVPENDKYPILTPNKYIPPAKQSRLNKNIFNDLEKHKVRSKINSFADWIVSFIHKPEQKLAINQKLESLKSYVKSLFAKVRTKKFKIRKTASAIKGFTKQYTIDGTSGIDSLSFLNAVRPHVVNLLSENRQTKINLVLTCAIERVDMQTGQEESAHTPFVSKTEVILDATDINEIYSNAISRIPETMANFQMRGSNWRFMALVKLDVDTVTYKPLKGSSYISLPVELVNKKAIINMKNDDNECFKWCVTRALNPTDNNPQRITNKLIEQSKKLDWRGIEFPVAADASVITKFERNNTNVNINVFGYGNKIIFPIYVSNQRDITNTNVVELLLISDGERKHYCLIKNFNRLIALRTAKSHNSMHYCRRCLIGYRNTVALNKHSEYCSQHAAQKIELPQPGTMLSFKNYNRSMRVPFIVYADFESFIKPIDTCQPDPSLSYSHTHQKHIHSSFCYYVKCFDDSLYQQDPVTYIAKNEDDDVARVFVDSLEDTIKQIYDKFKFPKKMIFNSN